MPKIVTVDVDPNRERHLKFDINALADVERVADKSVLALMEKGRAGFDTLRTLLWGGLKWEDRGLTLERAGAMLQAYMEAGGDIQALTEKILAALYGSGAFGKLDEQVDRGNGKAEEGT